MAWHLLEAIRHLIVVTADFEFDFLLPNGDLKLSIKTFND